MEDSSNRLINKSLESFLLAIEIYNKPTIKYREEGFLLFIVNAWELMLKAQIIKQEGEDAILREDRPDKTIMMTTCVKKLFPKENNPLRRNLESVIELRNLGAHKFIDEYEEISHPLLQKNVLYFIRTFKDYFGKDINEIVNTNTILLPILFSLNSETNIVGKYPTLITNEFFKIKNKIENLTNKYGEEYAIKYTVQLTKDENEGALKVRVDQNAKDAIPITTEFPEINKTHPYTTNKMVELINKHLRKKKIDLKFKNQIKKFSTFHFNNFNIVYKIKENKKYCYTNTIFKATQYSYSNQALSFILKKLEENPNNILDEINMKAKVKKNNKSKKSNTNN